MKLNRKELFAVSMVLLAGFLYLLLEAISLFSRLGSGEKFDIGGFKIKQFNLLMDIKMIALGLLCVLGSWLFFKLKNAGWIICTSILLNIFFITGIVLLTAASANYWNILVAFDVALLAVSVLAIVCLFTKQTRLKFTVNNKSYLISFLLYIAMVALFSAL